MDRHTSGLRSAEDQCVNRNLIRLLVGEMHLSDCPDKVSGHSRQRDSAPHLDHQLVRAPRVGASPEISTPRRARWSGDGARANYASGRYDCRRALLDAGLQSDARVAAGFDFEDSNYRRRRSPAKEKLFTHTKVVRTHVRTVRSAPDCTVESRSAPRPAIDATVARSS